MPLTRFTLRDQLVSEEIHMLDVALGHTRPEHRVERAHATRFGGSPRLTRQSPVVDTSMLSDVAEHEPDTKAVAKALRERSAGTVDVYRETQDHNRKPVMTMDDTSLRDSLIGAIKLPRWADGAAYGVSHAFHLAVRDIEASEDLGVDVLIESDRRHADVLLSGVEEGKVLSPDERGVLIEAARASCQDIPIDRVLLYMRTALWSMYCAPIVLSGRFEWPVRITGKWLSDGDVLLTLRRQASALRALRERSRCSLATRSDDYLVRDGKLVRGSVLLDPHFLDWQGPRKALRSARSFAYEDGGPDRFQQVQSKLFTAGYMPWHQPRHRFVVDDDGVQWRQTGWVKRDTFRAGTKGAVKIAGGDRWVKLPAVPAGIRVVPAHWEWNDAGRLHFVKAKRVKTRPVPEKWSRQIVYTVMPRRLGGLQPVVPLGQPSEIIARRDLIRLLMPVLNAAGRMRIEEIGVFAGPEPARAITGHAKGTRTSWVGKYRLYASAAACLNVRVYGPRGIARPKPVVPVARDPERWLSVQTVELDVRAALAEHVPHQGAPRNLIGDTIAPTGVDAGQGARTRATRAALNI